MEIEIWSEYVTLGQVLKMAGLVGTGGETKMFLESVPIRVNGEDENRRGRKLRVGDVVVIRLDRSQTETITLIAPTNPAPDDEDADNDQRARTFSVAPKSRR